MPEKPSKKDELFDAKKEISDLKMEIKRLDTILIISEKYENSTTDKIEGKIKEFSEIYDKTMSDAKKEITTFTFELIAIIVGFLSLLLAIMVLTVNQGEINNEMLYFYFILGVASVLLFLGFVLSWRKKNFPKVEGMTYDNIISYINSNNSDMGDYIDSKISNVGDLIESINSDMRDCIKDEISKCRKYTNNKISEAVEFIKENK
ncbi:MAG: hypothetical protein K8S16_19685 [Bacteroidales bacterium]|nr:hypothetical protein [Bacteroidales bacterium]